MTEYDQAFAHYADQAALRSARAVRYCIGARICRAAATGHNRRSNWHVVRVPDPRIQIARAD